MNELKQKRQMSLEFAIQQLIGFNHAKQGYSIECLAEDMNLSLDELENIKEVYPISDQQYKQIKDHLAVLEGE